MTRSTFSVVLNAIFIWLQWHFTATQRSINIYVTRQQTMFCYVHQKPNKRNARLNVRSFILSRNLVYGVIAMFDIFWHISTGYKTPSNISQFRNFIRFCEKIACGSLKTEQRSSKYFPFRHQYGLSFQYDARGCCKPLVHCCCHYVYHFNRPIQKYPINMQWLNQPTCAIPVYKCNVYISLIHTCTNW